jgi:hypothetical protein
MAGKNCAHKLSLCAFYVTIAALHLALFFICKIWRGFFAFFAYFMCMMCLVVLLNPYRYFKLYPIVGLYVFSLCVELLIS